MQPFKLDLSRFPGQIAIFPLDALLLPTGLLSLNIFEPRYLAMLEDTLGTSDRFIGMVIPGPRKDGLYPVGCAGRVTMFEEGADGVHLIQLTGICRFRLGSLETGDWGYTLAEVGWNEFSRDIERDDSRMADRERLVGLARQYMPRRIGEVGTDAITKSTDAALLNILAILCPLDSAEKQAIIEANTLAERTELLTTIIEMALHEGKGNDARH